MKLCCWRTDTQSIHPIETVIQTLINEHFLFLKSCKLGLYTLITVDMIHILTERTARITGIIHSLNYLCSEAEAKRFYTHFLLIDNLIYEELSRQFKHYTIRLTSDAMKLLYIQKRIIIGTSERSESAFF